MRITIMQEKWKKMSFCQVLHCMNKLRRYNLRVSADCWIIKGYNKHNLFDCFLSPTALYETTTSSRSCMKISRGPIFYRNCKHTFQNTSAFISQNKYMYYQFFVQKISVLLITFIYGLFTLHVYHDTKSPWYMFRCKLTCSYVF